MKTTKKTKFVSVTLAILLIIQLIPVQCFAVSSADSTSDKTENTSIEDYESPRIIAEADDEREECVKHFMNSDGSFSAVSYIDPVHYSYDKYRTSDKN